MPLTPTEIYNREFGTALRGYARDDVEEFREEVMRAFEALVKENAELRQQTEQLNEKLSHYYNLEQTLHNALVVAQETSEEVKRNAKHEAELIIKQAEVEARETQERAFSQKAKLEGDLDELRSRINLYRERVRRMIQAQLDMLSTEAQDISDEA